MPASQRRSDLSGGPAMLPGMQLLLAGVGMRRGAN